MRKQESGQMRQQHARQWQDVADWLVDAGVATLRATSGCAPCLG